MFVYKLPSTFFCLLIKTNSASHAMQYFLASFVRLITVFVSTLEITHLVELFQQKAREGNVQAVG